jgi:hypothetical protein
MASLPSNAQKSVNLNLLALLLRSKAAFNQTNMIMINPAKLTNGLIMM